MFIIFSLRVTCLASAMTARYATADFAGGLAVKLVQKISGFRGLPMFKWSKVILAKKDRGYMPPVPHRDDYAGCASRRRVRNKSAPRLVRRPFDCLIFPANNVENKGCENPL